MTDDEIIAVVQAHKAGKKIQMRASETSPFKSIVEDMGWVTLDRPPQWDFINLAYRAAPEPPKPREWWLDFKDGGRHAEAYSHNYCGDCVRVREVLR